MIRWLTRGALAFVVACGGSDPSAIGPGASTDQDGNSVADGGTGQGNGNTSDGGRDGGDDGGPKLDTLGTHFDGAPVSWSVAANGGFETGGFSQVAATWWTTTDIDGDGKSDLVVTAEWFGETLRVVGGAASPHWLVYKNTGGAFASTPTVWPVPQSGSLVTNGFGQTASTMWSTTDMDGDGKPDLVVTAERAPNGDLRVVGGTTSPHWRVYKNTGAGFASTSVDWAVPQAGTLATAGISSMSWIPWATMDMDGDKKPDLVVTAERVNGALRVVGGTIAPHWRVFKNTGSGFAANAVDWAVPQAGELSSAGISQVAWTPWTTMDIDGDQKPDLVVTAESNDGELQVVGGSASPHWLVYKNSGAGFASAATSWPVPKAGTLSTAGFSQASWVAWSTTDLDGDHKPDLVVTGERNASDDIVVPGEKTSPHWRIYTNTGSGFDAGHDWSVPAEGGFPFGGFSQVASMRWATLDLDGDGRSDLVVTGELLAGGDTAVFGADASPFWKVYRNVP